MPQGAAKEWGALDDVVMGGRSESGFEVKQGAGESGGATGVFSGIVTEGKHRMIAVWNSLLSCIRHVNGIMIVGDLKSYHEHCA